MNKWKLSSSPAIPFILAKHPGAQIFRAPKPQRAA